MEACSGMNQKGKSSNYAPHNKSEGEGRGVSRLGGPKKGSVPRKGVWLAKMMRLGRVDGAVKLRGLDSSV